MNGVKNMELSMIKGKEAMVFDASGDVGKILTCGPGQIKIFATIVGKSSHAGLALEEGIQCDSGRAVNRKMNLLKNR